MNKIKHDKLIDELVDIIKDDYDLISTNVKIYDKHRKSMVLAEIDVLAKKGKRLDAYEVKAKPRMTKASVQLQRIRTLMPEVTDIFFFSGESGRLTKITD